MNGLRSEFKPLDRLSTPSLSNGLQLVRYPPGGLPHPRISRCGAFESRITNHGAAPADPLICQRPLLLSLPSPEPTPHHMFSSPEFPARHCRGFTLIELLVV